MSDQDPVVMLANKLSDAGVEFHDAMVWINLIEADAIRDAARAMPVYGAKGEPRTFDPSGDEDVRDFLEDYAKQVENSSKPVDSRRRPSVR